MGYSAKVSLSLVVDGLELQLSHVGPKDVIIRSECHPIPPTDAKLIIKVDDSTIVDDVFLPFGIKGARDRVVYI